MFTIYSDIDSPCDLHERRNQKLVEMLDQMGVKFPIGRIAFEAHRKTFEKITFEIKNLWLILFYDGCYNLMKNGKTYKFGSIETAQEYIERATSA